jgi:hypothetical protein
VSLSSLLTTPGLSSSRASRAVPRPSSAFTSVPSQLLCADAPPFPPACRRQRRRLRTDRIAIARHRARAPRREGATSTSTFRRGEWELSSARAIDEMAPAAFRSEPGSGNRRAEAQSRRVPRPPHQPDGDARFCSLRVEESSAARGDLVGGSTTGRSDLAYRMRSAAPTLTRHPRC